MTADDDADSSVAVPREGETATVSRTFTREEVETFVELSGDEGDHHVEPDEDGRVVVHGLLLALLPTERGGERNVLARTMEYEFHRPAYTGEELTCELTTESVEELDDRYRVASSGVCRNEAGETVMTASFDGVIFK